MNALSALERYLTDCESKRRRRRDRPSDAVLTELRSLLDYFDSPSIEREASLEAAGQSETPQPQPDAAVPDRPLSLDALVTDEGFGRPN